MTQGKFCPLPFGHAMIATNGDFQICCIHHTPPEHKVNIGQHSYEHWRDSEYVQQVRDSFAKGQAHAGCNHCWHREQLGQNSLRTRVSKEYQILQINSADDAPPYPVNVEINLGNLCNLKCLMCSESDSSALLAENIKLGINQFKQEDFHWSPQAFENLKQLLAHEPQVINIRGGEPFYNKDLLTLVEQLPAETCAKTLLHITTNATVWNQKWAQALAKFRLVRIMASVDGVGQTYEYLRHPASWTQVAHNILTMQKLPRTKVLVHCVAQNLNVTSLGELIDWCQDHNLYLELDQLMYPAWLSLTNLPRANKQQAMQAVTQQLDKNLPEHLKRFLRLCQQQLAHALDQPDDQDLWKLFESQVGQRDRLRNTDFRSLL